MSPERRSAGGRSGGSDRAKRARAGARDTKGEQHWTFLSNHAHVLLLLAQDSTIRLRDVAERVGITERAVQRIVADLEHGRYIQREKDGRRNRYRVYSKKPLRHPVEAHRDVGALVDLILNSRA